MRAVAAKMFNKDDDYPPVEPEDIVLRDRAAHAPDGRSISHRDIALYSLHTEDQHQIMATGSWVSPDSPPPFAAQFVTCTVDTETGQITVDEMVMAVDGVIHQPDHRQRAGRGGMMQGSATATARKWQFKPTRPHAQPTASVHTRSWADECGAWRNLR